MLKKLCLFIALAIPSLFAQTTDNSLQIVQINNTLKHINIAKKSILAEIKMALLLKEKSEKHFKSILLSDYNNIATTCLELLRVIALSKEFIITIEQVTDDQLNLIVNNLIDYNDIIIDPSLYPLEQKRNNELSLAGFDEQKEQVFNVFYVTYAIMRGGQTLLKKLKIKERALGNELEHLQLLQHNATT